VSTYSVRHMEHRATSLEARAFELAQQAKAFRSLKLMASAEAIQQRANQCNESALYWRAKIAEALSDVA